MELSPNRDHKQVVRDIVSIVFQRDFETITKDSLDPENAYQGRIIELTPTRTRRRSADVMETQDALTVIYREFTPRKRLRRSSLAIRLPKDSEDLRVMRERQTEFDYFEFARGDLAGDELNQGNLIHWHPILREVIERAASG